MKVKIINEKLPYFNESCEVVKINFDMVVARTNEKKVYLDMNDVQFIPENIYENTLLNNKDILKIKLNSGISIFLYIELIVSLEDKICGKIENIVLLKDEYKSIRRGLWEKQITLVVNEKFPFDIVVIGRNYDKKFDITIKEVILEDFVSGCNREIKNLTKEISEKEGIIKIYKNILKNVLDNSIKIDRNNFKTLKG